MHESRALDAVDAQGEMWMARNISIVALGNKCNRRTVSILASPAITSEKSSRVKGSVMMEACQSLRKSGVISALVKNRRGDRPQPRAVQRTNPI